MASQDQEHFRDSIGTINEEGKRSWVYPKKPVGKLYEYRKLVSYVLLIFLFGAPFIHINGNQFLMFNVLERRFNIFGFPFWPQDFHLFVIIMITGVVFVVLFTVAFGRLFCGWICPQTIFMEMVFRKIEYWIEGDFNAQKRLDKAPWTSDKLRKKVLKHAIFIAISILIAHTFLSYLVGLERVTEIVTSPPSENFGGFFAMVAFTGAFYFVFSRLREQVCTTICPYGRLQGVMTDQNTILVAYDFVRGEPRGKIRKSAARSQQSSVNTPESVLGLGATGMEPPLGDCIDCHLCVKVCPTGIDIRDGVQMECVNCTACMDACDEVMDKVGRPRGLIRYDSHNGIEKQRRKIFTPRVIGYTVVLAVLLVVNVLMFMGRSDVEAVILRTPGMLYQEVDETHLSNLYNYQVFNKTSHEMPIEFRVKDGAGVLKLVGDAPTVPGSDMAEGAFFIEMEKDKLTDRKHKVRIEVLSGGEVVDEVTTNFLGPVK